MNSVGHNDEPMPNLFTESTTSKGEESEYTVEFLSNETPAPDLPLPESDDKIELEEQKLLNNRKLCQVFLEFNGYVSQSYADIKTGQIFIIINIENMNNSDR